ncbi:uncharacterized membrane protein YcaP (DUF421 family) [Bacillus ectoiniformans]|uniref:DUF421 domain-containing protein n=1 Tax=Bacillus ectoiniformans TaxID=1494429 RepID=UPI00195A1644|nr:DUF421 domain-containing protein [Bacillus ectoiniformans]MBM7650244.1 uncharacterized membrane protein YcaP (DUF421 family) [Bacillus ectoiniformans]
MEITWNEFFILVGRVVTILPLMLGVTLFMGRRSIGELPVFDFLILMSLGAVVGADIADPKIEHIHTAVAIILIGLLQKAVAILKIKSRMVGQFITFEPIVVIMNGEIIEKNLRKIQYSIDNLLFMLREDGVFDISHVQVGIIEGNGKLTILKTQEKQEVTNEDLNIVKTASGLSYPVIIEGKLFQEVLDFLQLNEEFIKERLRYVGVQKLEEVFFASIDEEKNVTVTLKNRPIHHIPPISH